MTDREAAIQEACGTCHNETHRSIQSRGRCIVMNCKATPDTCRCAAFRALVDRAVEEAKKQRQFRNCEHQFGAYRDCTREARFCREHMEGAVAEDRAALVAAGDALRYPMLTDDTAPPSVDQNHLASDQATWDARAHPKEP